MARGGMREGAGRPKGSRSAATKQECGKIECRDEAGRFLPGNRFWKVRSSAGPRPKFKMPEQLWAACCEYFDWNADNPLFEDKLVTFQGKATHEPISKMRAMTIGGLCMFLDIDETTWRDWRAKGGEHYRADLSPIIARAESIIRCQKFEGAAADLLNASIIARELGLADTTKLAGHDGGAIETVEPKLTPKELARRLLFILADAANQQKEEQERDVEREAS